MSIRSRLKYGWVGELRQGDKVFYHFSYEPMGRQLKNAKKGFYVIEAGEWYLGPFNSREEADFANMLMDPIAQTTFNPLDTRHHPA